MALVATVDENCPLPQLQVADPLAALQQIARAHRLQFAGRVIGVTGSCGKTSTKNILRTLLGEACHATAGNLNNFIGVPLTLLGLETDEAPQRSPRFAVIEAGISEPGEMAVLADMIRPDIALVTMVGPAHLQGLGSMANVAAEKSMLAASEGLPLVFAPLECWAYPAFAALPNAGVAVAELEAGGDGDYFVVSLPVDERGDGNDDLRKELAQMAEQRQSAAGCAQEAAERAALEAALPPSISLHRYTLEYLAAPQAGAEVFLSITGARLSGRFALGFKPSAGMASNLALALIAAHTCGIAVDLLAQRVRTWQPADNRGEWVQGAGKRFYVDCYNANPASMQDSLAHFTSALAFGGDTLRAQPRLYVIGGMRELGAESAHWHRQVGLQLGLLASGESHNKAVVAIGEAADTEALEAGIRVYSPKMTVHRFTKTEEARALLAAFSGVVFLKGSRFYALESLLPQESLLAQESLPPQAPLP